MISEFVLNYWPILVVMGLIALARTIHVSLFTKYFKLTYTDAPVWTFLYFSAFALAVVLIFHAEAAILFAHVSPIGYITLLFLFVVVFPVIYRWLRLRSGVPKWLMELFPDEPILSLEERFILAKIADVVFQDLAAGVIILTLVANGLTYPVIVGIFVALFAAAHFYIFKTSGLFWGLYYSTYAALGGFAIPFLILFVPGGIAYVLVLHMLFYVISSVLFAKLPRPSRHVLHDLTGVS